MSHATPNTIASHGQPYPYKESDTPQPGTNTSDYDLNLSQYGDTHKNSDDVRSFPTDYGPRNSHEGEIPYCPLTSRVLYEHNLEQAYTPGLPESQQAIPHGYTSIVEAAVAPANDNLRTKSLKSKLFRKDTTSQTESQQHGKAGMYNEADRDTPDYQYFSHRQSRSAYQENAIDMPGPDMSDVDPPSWHLDQDHELTAWGNTLAGVGEHLVDHTYEEYTSHDKLVVEE